MAGNPKIILISGKQGSGKDTLAAELTALLRAVEDARVKQFMFAQTIYEIHNYARQLLFSLGIKLDLSQKDGDLLQYLGTEWGRKKFGKHVWTTATIARINKWVDPLDYVIITDCRFKNEFNAFSDAYKVRLTCPENIRKKRRGKTWRKNTKHASEVDLDGYEKAGKFDLVLDTNEYGPDACAQIVFDLISS